MKDFLLGLMLGLLLFIWWMASDSTDNTDPDDNIHIAPFPQRRTGTDR